MNAPKPPYQGIYEKLCEEWFERYNGNNKWVRYQEMAYLDPYKLKAAEIHAMSRKQQSVIAARNWILSNDIFRKADPTHGEFIDSILNAYHDDSMELPRPRCAICNYKPLVPNLRLIKTHVILLYLQFNCKNCALSGDIRIDAKAEPQGWRISSRQFNELISHVFFMDQAIEMTNNHRKIVSVPNPVSAAILLAKPGTRRLAL